MNFRKISSEQEKRVAKTLNEKVVRGSGSLDFLKGDVIGDIFIECKTNATPKRQITVKKEWFEKAKQQALIMRKSDFAIVFSFGDGTDYYAVDHFQFENMYKAMKVVQQLQEMVGTDGYKLNEEEIQNIRKVISENYSL